MKQKHILHCLVSALLLGAVAAAQSAPVTLKARPGSKVQISREKSGRKRMTKMLLDMIPLHLFRA